MFGRTHRNTHSLTELAGRQQPLRPTIQLCGSGITDENIGWIIAFSAHLEIERSEVFQSKSATQREREREREGYVPAGLPFGKCNLWESLLGPILLKLHLRTN